MKTLLSTAIIFCGFLTTVDSVFAQTWIQTIAPSAVWQSIASSSDGTKLAAVAQQGEIYTSTDSGETWTSNTMPNYEWQSIASSADGTKLAAVVNFFGIWTLQTTPLPQLSLVSSSTNLVLSWTIPSTNFAVQQSSDLISWSNVTNTPTLNFNNLNNELTLSPTNSSGFFRLIS